MHEIGKLPRGIEIFLFIFTQYLHWLVNRGVLGMQAREHIAFTLVCM